MANCEIYWIMLNVSGKSKIQSRSFNLQIVRQHLFQLLCVVQVILTVWPESRRKVLKWDLYDENIWAVIPIVYLYLFKDRKQAILVENC